MRMMPGKLNRRLGQGKQRLIVFAYGWLYNGDKREGNTMNNMEKQIRALRLKKNITQEALAGELLASPQAVSKWENGQTLPDIMLLPVGI
jgi:DNA-binding XRE family transcriptional regulator